MSNGTDAPHSEQEAVSATLSPSPRGFTETMFSEGDQAKQKTTPMGVPEVARLLGVSVPRVHRLLDAEGVSPAGGRGRARVVSPEIVRRLVRRIGAVPIHLPGYDRTDLLVLTAVARAALGLVSTRAVARAAGVSPTAAGASLARLTDRGLVTRRERRVVLGRIRQIRFWVADVTNPAWTLAIHAATKAVSLPIFAPTAPPRRVPSAYGHAFWNVNLRTIDPVRDADFVAVRLFQLDNPSAWAWAVRNLPVESLRRAALNRGFDTPHRNLINNVIATKVASESEGAGDD